MRKTIGVAILILAFCGAAKAQSSQIKIGLGGTYANGTITIVPILPAEQAHAIKTAFLDTGGAALLTTLTPGFTYWVTTCTSTGGTCLAAVVSPNGATQDITSTLQANPYGSGAGGTPGGSSGQTQYNNAGAFGGYTPSGDYTIVPSTGVATVKGVNGVLFSGLATGLVKNTTTTGVPSIASASDILTACTGCAPLASPAMTGTPTAPTATVGTNTTQLATTAFVLANGGGVTFRTVGLWVPNTFTAWGVGTTPCNPYASGTAAGTCTGSPNSAVSGAAIGAGTVNGLLVHLGAAQGTASSFVVTVQKNGGATSMTCTIAATATDCSDKTHTFSIVDTDVVWLIIVGAGVNLQASSGSITLEIGN